MANVLAGVGATLFFALNVVAAPVSTLAKDAATACTISLETLEAADAFHERLNELCSTAGAIAFYEGALSNRMVAGIPPLSRSGRWDVYPREKITRDYSFTPQLATTEDDRLFCLQVGTTRGGEVVELIVKGVRINVVLLGVARNWRFPRSPELTVESLLEQCSDSLWTKKIAEERKAAGLDRNEAKSRTEKRKIDAIIDHSPR
jgi:hypothetical protein